jgi:7-cyano-7-deazaguanine synthase
MSEPSAAIAVLISGGLDSAILLGEMLKRQPTVQPLYVRNGLYWEAVELEHLRRFLAALAGPALRALQVLELPVADLYGSHWSITGEDVPDASTPDEAVFLPGRNVLLLAKSLLWCHLHGIGQLALGVLGSNPFPDASDEFFAEYQRAVNRAVDGQVEVQRPFAGLSKAQVMQRGRDLPLELSFSCIRPLRGRHCGACNKCAERRQAFADAGLTDRTPYDGEGPCIA